MNEIWKDIENYEGYYQASNLGRVKRIGKKILKHGIEGSGYQFVFLCKNGIPKKYSVHRLIASTFIENIENKREVNHIDGNKLNNNVDNLEWCTCSENKLHAYRIGLFKAPFCGKNGRQHFASKPIMQFSLNGDFIKEWDNAPEVERQTGFNSQNVGACARGKLKTAYKFIWKFNNNSNIITQ